MIDVCIYKGNQCLWHNHLKEVSAKEAVRVMARANGLNTDYLEKISEKEFKREKDLGIEFLAETTDIVMNNRKGHFKI